MTIHQVTLEATNLYGKLQSAFRQATMDEAAIRELMDSRKTPRMDEVILERLDKVTSTLLPEAFGRFISGLDLQNSFRHLGIYVRSFADAEFVIKNMEPSILSQIGNLAITEPCIWIDDLAGCCQELSMIYRSLTGTSLEA